MAESELLRYVEAGGWALAPELRCTTEALHIALASYALGELLGGCLGLSTATVRHHSSSILRRLGGNTLVWDGRPLPPYYDPAYRCEMEIVRFDSRLPNPKYQALVNQLKAELAMAPVFCASQGTEDVDSQSRQLLSLSNAVGRSAASRARDSVDVSVFRWCSMTHQALTHQALTDQAFETTIEQLEAALQSAADGVIVTDIHGRIEFLNSNAESLTGIRSSVAQGRPCTKCCCWKKPKVRA